jgi:hypothetical protein
MFVYNLSETEYLTFKTQRDHFELYSGHEAGGDLKRIAIYRGGKWLFESYDQQKLFWFLFNMFKKQFGKAMKAYVRSLNEKPKTYVIICAKRRIDIKVQKLKRDWDNWFYNFFYSR